MILYSKVRKLQNGGAAAPYMGILPQKSFKDVAPTTITPTYIKDKKAVGPAKEIPWYSTPNYKNWGLKDYSDYSSFNSAFRNARENGEQEFMYKDKRYHTKLIDKKHSDLYHESKAFLENYLENQNYKPKAGFTLSLNSADEYDFQKNGVKNETIENFQNRKLKERDLQNLREPIYFSITSEPDTKYRSEGYHKVDDMGNSKIYMSTPQGKESNKLNTIFIHELMHKAQNKDVYLRTPPITNLPHGVIASQAEFDYLSDPYEIEARKMSTLFYAHKNKKDLSSMTLPEFNSWFLKNEDNMPEDVVQLFKLYSNQRGDLLKFLKNNFEYEGK